MLAKTTTLIGMLGALEGASALHVKPRQILGNEGENIASRVQGGAKIGDLCHPAGTYALGGKKLIDPCIAEQAISVKCERLTQMMTAPNAERRKAYHACLTGGGSSFIKDVKACMVCKREFSHMTKDQFTWFDDKWTKGYEAFAKDAEPQFAIWSYVQRAIDGDSCTKQGDNQRKLNGWACWDQLPKPVLNDTAVNATAGGVVTSNATQKLNVTALDYYKDRPATQNIGKFTLEGKQYPETGSVELGLLVPTFEITANLGYYSSARVQPGKFEANITNGKVEIITEYREIKAVCNFTKPDEFTILPLITGPVPVKDSVVVVAKKDADQLPIAVCDKSCRAEAPAIEKIQETAAKPAQVVNKEVAKACEPALKALESNKPVNKESVNAVVEKVKISTEIAAPETFKPVVAPQAPVQTIGGGNKGDVAALDQNKPATVVDQTKPNCPQPSFKVTICQLPGAKDCKEFEYKAVA
ncbi:hypothetical protein VFPPC_10071 [Pochonia chlamydosporia 170]|uniref:Uncharacterized protein n=1 Tax=Pochonia chlamydosporia 170 TaxID=1380566 RepID=A0A179F3H7_METCM|nr:hypothetical protein VFPPC_10071 [Pochonia chlamydosporia 170]OAQ59976.1 hypothetical protein VFPPC_10071 [Pochonia chlamydosporia 170]